MACEVEVVELVGGMIVGLITLGFEEDFGSLTCTFLPAMIEYGAVIIIWTVLSTLKWFMFLHVGNFFFSDWFEALIR